MNGWPVDMIRIEDEVLLYEPLGIKAKRLPLKTSDKAKYWHGQDGLFAWRVEAPFDMEW